MKDTVSVRFDAGLGRNVFALDSESNTNLSIQRGRYPLMKA